MRKAVCKNNRQQVVLKKSSRFERASSKDCGSGGLEGFVCLCVCERAKERMCFTAAFHGKLLSTVFEGYIGLIGKCLLLHAWFP